MFNDKDLESLAPSLREKLGPQQRRVRILALRVFEFMDRESFEPLLKNQGICGNAQQMLKDCLEGKWGGFGDDTHLDLTVSQAEDLILGSIRFYAGYNGLHMQFPIENSYHGYSHNPRKWEGKWLVKRRALIGKVIQYLKTGDDSYLAGIAGEGL